MLGTGESPEQRVAAAAERTVAARTARVFAAMSSGSPVPVRPDRHSEGVADFATRRTQVAQVMLAGRLAELASRAGDGSRTAHRDSGGQAPGAAGQVGTARPEPEDGGSAHVSRGRGGGWRGKLGDALALVTGPQDMIYDGGRAYVRAEGRWNALPSGHPDGPRHWNDPLWPLDALAGGGDNVAEAEPDIMRGTAVLRYRLTVDLARADAALAAGVSVPAGPYRGLRRLPAEVWLDEAGLVRRVAVPASLEPRQEDKVIWAVTELWDFGLAVTIDPPHETGAKPDR